MKQLWISISALMLFSLFSSAQAAGQTQRHFMFIGEPSAAAWKYMMENPQDRKKQVEGAFKALGGKVISYYFGLGDGKNL